MNTNKTQAEQLPQDAVMQSVFKAEDLRVGNLVYKNYRLFQSEIRKVDALDINFHLKHPEVNSIGPINLTEEWLLKFGFELKGFYRLKVTSFLELCWKPHDNTLNLQTEKNGFTEDSKCKYVHQLQNLYFALTGSELTVA